MSETCWYHLECVQFNAGNDPFSLFSPIGLPFYFCWRNYSLLLYLQYHEKLCLPSSLECICDRNGFGLSLILINSRLVSYKVFNLWLLHSCPCAFWMEIATCLWHLCNIIRRSSLTKRQWIQCRQNRWCHTVHLWRLYLWYRERS